MQQSASGRLDGLDLARFLAFVGMVIVNFKVVVTLQYAEASGLSVAAPSGALDVFLGLFEGRAAATFVVLAGIGLGLSALRQSASPIIVTLKRAVFLLVLGLGNMMIFEADIIHYYAFYFLIGAFLLRLSNSTLLSLVLLVNLIFLTLVTMLNYDTGWDWDSYAYSGFWTLEGFVRNLFFNGWHPVFPWIGFLIFGIWLSRQRLADTSIQMRMILVGTVMIAVAELVSRIAQPWLDGIEPELGLIVSTEPIPPMPFYAVAGIGMALVVVGLSLRLSDWMDHIGLLNIVKPAGRQTLTLYFAHILIGMGALEAMGLVGGGDVQDAFIAAMIFCVGSVVYAWVWAKWFKHGPLESLMRRIAG